MTAMTIFERWYLVVGLAPIGVSSQLSVCSHTPTAHKPAILDFRAIFFSSGIFLVITDCQVIWPSPGTLGASW